MRPRPTQHRRVIEPRHYRDVLGRFATGVTIVAATTPDGPVGLAVSAFASVSLDPPLVLFCVTRASRSWTSIEQAGVFGVSVLRDDQEQISRRFAGPGRDRFAGVAITDSELGVPLIDQALAHVECTIEAVHRAGDHYVVIGRVARMDATDGLPLLYFRGAYETLYPPERA